uniref:Uncharacterized protein n=1 Tax=Pipistrellus kuhlii TaxID=59472 RepID=A0A7J8B2W5_PIPKU|nr:hypothetical protein mPipKuh1_007879 [Pipistrellus kuhlii]
MKSSQCPPDIRSKLQDTGEPAHPGFNFPFPCCQRHPPPPSHTHTLPSHTSLHNQVLMYLCPSLFSLPTRQTPLPPSGKLLLILQGPGQSSPSLSSLPTCFPHPWKAELINLLLFLQHWAAVHHMVEGWQAPGRQEPYHIDSQPPPETTAVPDTKQAGSDRSVWLCPWAFSHSTDLETLCKTTDWEAEAGPPAKTLGRC